MDLDWITLISSPRSGSNCFRGHTAKVLPACALELAGSHPGNEESTLSSRTSILATAHLPASDRYLSTSDIKQSACGHQIKIYLRTDGVECWCSGCDFRTAKPICRQNRMSDGIAVLEGVMDLSQLAGRAAELRFDGLCPFSFFFSLSLGSSVGHLAMHGM